MANTPQVIQKDLGLVTAYGYALAGGYQGTEAEFIEDFGKLMNGRIHSDFTFDTIAQMNAAIMAGDIPENATIYCKEEAGSSANQMEYGYASNYYNSRNEKVADNTVTVYVSGNMTFLSMTAIFSSALTIPANSKASFAVKRWSTEAGKELSKKIYGKFVPRNTLGVGTASVLGFSYLYQFDSGNRILNNPKIHVDYETYAQTNSGKLYSITAIYSLANHTNDAITINSGETIYFDHIFVNRTATETTLAFP